MRYKNHGFTLIELLVAMAIVGIIGSMGFGAYKTAQNSSQKEGVVAVVVSTIRRAQVQAQAADSDSMWGVRFSGRSVVLFCGASFASRDIGKDETFSLPAGFTISGTTDVVYSKMNGLPDAAKSISILGTNGQNATITINAKGVITY